MIPENKQLPAWIENNIPQELTQGNPFCFKVQLSKVNSYEIIDCEICRGTKQDPDDPGLDCNICNGKGKQKKAQYQTVEVNVLPDLNLDYDNLEQQMQDLPAQYSFWAVLYSEARLAVALAERKLKVRRGKAARAIEQQAKRREVRLPSDQIKLIIESDRRIVCADLELQRQQMMTGKLYHMIEALKMKAELARSLAGFKRQERQEQERS